jgi:hypothetical protein
MLSFRILMVPPPHFPIPIVCTTKQSLRQAGGYSRMMAGSEWLHLLKSEARNSEPSKSMAEFEIETCHNRGEPCRAVEAAPARCVSVIGPEVRAVSISIFGFRILASTASNYPHCRTREVLLGALVRFDRTASGAWRAASVRSLGLISCLFRISIFGFQFRCPAALVRALTFPRLAPPCLWPGRPPLWRGRFVCR